MPVITKATRRLNDTLLAGWMMVITLMASLSNTYASGSSVFTFDQASAKYFQEYQQQNLGEFENYLRLTPIIKAVQNNNVEAIPVFIRSGVNVNAKTLGGFTALHLAAVHNNASAVQALIAGGANVNSIDQEEWTPLMRAALNGGVEAVQALLASDRATVWNTNIFGETAILHASLGNCYTCALAILNYIQRKNLHSTDTTAALQQLDHAIAVAEKKNNQPLKELLINFRQDGKVPGNDITTQIGESLYAVMQKDNPKPITAPAVTETKPATPKADPTPKDTPVAQLLPDNAEVGTNPTTPVEPKNTTATKYNFKGESLGSDGEAMGEIPILEETPTTVATTTAVATPTPDPKVKTAEKPLEVLTINESYTPLYRFTGQQVKDYDTAKRQEEIRQQIQQQPTKSTKKPVSGDNKNTLKLPPTEEHPEGQEISLISEKVTDTPVTYNFLGQRISEPPKPVQSDITDVAKPKDKTLPSVPTPVSTRLKETPNTVSVAVQPQTVSAKTNALAQGEQLEITAELTANATADAEKDKSVAGDTPKLSSSTGDASKALKTKSQERRIIFRPKVTREPEPVNLKTSDGPSTKSTDKSVNKSNPHKTNTDGQKTNDKILDKPNAKGEDDQNPNTNTSASKDESEKKVILFRPKVVREPEPVNIPNKKSSDKSVHKSNTGNEANSIKAKVPTSKTATESDTTKVIAIPTSDTKSKDASKQKPIIFQPKTTGEPKPLNITSSDGKNSKTNATSSSATKSKTSVTPDSETKATSTAGQKTSGSKTKDGMTEKPNGSRSAFRPKSVQLKDVAPVKLTDVKPNPAAKFNPKAIKSQGQQKPDKSNKTATKSTDKTDQSPNTQTQKSAGSPFRKTSGTETLK